MKHTAATSLVVALLVGGTPLLQGCSVGMALSGTQHKDTTVLFLGYPRGVVLEKLGPPDTSTVNAAGQRVDTYFVTRGNEPNLGRASLFAVLDILTLFFWELIATPIEMQVARSNRSTYMATYGPDDTMQDVQVVEAANE